MPELMPIDHVPDWEKRLQRQDAFWEGEIIDRPVVCISLPKPRPVYPEPKPKEYRTIRDRWMDTEQIAESALAAAVNTDYFGDALPNAAPNLGPEVLSAVFGLEMEYSETTSWAIPNLTSWDDVDQLQFSEDNFYWKKLVEITEALLAVGRNKFYTGLTDFHPGADWIAALRDPQQLALDLLEAPDQVKKLRRIIDDAYPRIFDFFYHKLRAAGQATTSWPDIVSTRKWYVPSNDFSCMISKPMFDEFFLPGIIHECRQMEANVYHLDGPSALQHLDSLLEIPELNAIQWVSGAGHGRASDWLRLYRKCQAAGKGLQIGLGVDELDTFIENLKPEGLWLGVWGVKDREHAEAVLRQAEQWT